MADLASAIHARLTADTAVNNLVETRVYPMNRPQDSALPAVRYQIISNEADRHLKGEAGSYPARIQFDCFDTDYDVAGALGRAVKAAMLSPATVAGVVFSGGEAFGPVDEAGTDTPAGHIYRTRVDLLVRHKLV